MSNGKPTEEQAQGWLEDIALDVQDSLATLNGLAALVDGSALSLLRLMDEIDRLSEDDRDYIVWLVAIERYAATPSPGASA